MPGWRRGAPPLRWPDLWKERTARWHLASLAQHVEPERTGERHRFREPHAHRIPEAVAKPGFFAGQCLMGLVVDKVIASQQRYRHEAVRAILRQGDK